MNLPSNEEHQHDDLIGYVLGALDPDEHQQIAQLVERDLDLQREILRIRAQVTPLDGLVPPGPPPAGLARRTCESVAAEPVPLPAVPAKSAVRPWFSNQREPLAGTSSWSLSDFITVAVVVLVLSSVILPALNYSRFQSRVLRCQNNLRQVGMGLLAFAKNSGDRFISIPAQGNLAVAGCYAPLLCESGYIEDPRLFLCAGLGVSEEREPPSCQEITSATGMDLIGLQKRMGGDYAYSLGYSDRGRYVPPRNLNRTRYVLLADNPSNQYAGRASRNHGGRGQNAFFEDGHVDFLSTSEIDGDSIYENDIGNIAPGLHASDIVVAPSGTRVVSLD